MRRKIGEDYVAGAVESRGKLYKASEACVRVGCGE